MQNESNLLSFSAMEFLALPWTTEYWEKILDVIFPVANFQNQQNNFRHEFDPVSFIGPLGYSNRTVQSSFEWIFNKAPKFASILNTNLNW